MKRRTMLATVGLSLSVAHVGCLDDSSASAGDERDDDGSDGAGDSDGGDDTDDGSDPDGTDADPDGDSDGGDDSAGDRHGTYDAEDVELTVGGEVETDRGVDEPPAIEIDGADSRVRIVGRVSYSSSSCGEVVLDSAGDDGDGGYEVRVAGERSASEGEECTDDITSSAYRVDVRFEGEVPDRITAVEDGFDGELVATAP